MPRLQSWFRRSDENPETQESESLPSRRIHVMGVGSLGTFVGHSLVGIHNPPKMSLMMHKLEMFDKFKRNNRSLRLITHKVHESRDGFDAEILDPEGNWLGLPADHKTTPPGTYPLIRRDDEIIYNLILTVKGTQTVKALRSISHRLRPSSTILFLQNGMGQISAVNENVFPNPKDRPTYMLGIISHGVYLQDDFIANHAGFGTTSLGIWRDFDKFPTPPKPTSIEGTVTAPQPSETPLWPITARYLLRTLTRTGVLCAAHFPELDIIQLQLEKLVMNAVVNPLTALLDVFNGSLLNNFYYLSIIRLLIAEMSLVIRSLPELKGVPNVDQRFSASRLERIVIDVIKNTAKNSSSMRQDVKHDKETELDFINGYIVKRGEELGIRCVINFTIMQLIKGKTWKGKDPTTSEHPIQILQGERQTSPVNISKVAEASPKRRRIQRATLASRARIQREERRRRMEERAATMRRKEIEAENERSHSST